MFLPHATRPPARHFLILCRMQADKACGLSCAAKVLDRLTPVSPVRHPFFPSPSVVPPTRQGNPQPVPPRQIPWPRPSPPSAGRTPNRPLRSDGVGLHAVAFRPWRLCVQSHVATRWRRPARRRPPPPPSLPAGRTPNRPLRRGQLIGCHRHRRLIPAAPSNRACEQQVRYPPPSKRSENGLWITPRSCRPGGTGLFATAPEAPGRTPNRAAFRQYGRNRQVLQHIHK